MENIYLDANATSRLRPQAGAAVEEFLRLSAVSRNPSSIHSSGRRARSLVSQARSNILNYLNGGQPSKAQLIFTSGGTESCNSLIFGFLGRAGRGKIVSSAIEHAAILEPLKQLSNSGYQLQLVSAERSGVVSIEKFLAEVDQSTALVSLMAANNETGAVQPVLELAKELRARGYRGAIVSDAVQLPGKVEFTLQQYFEAGVDALSFSAHKFGAPSGVGAVVIAPTGGSDRCLTFEPLLVGGPQERGYRAGTENVLGIVAWGEVCRDLERSQLREMRQIRGLRDRLWKRISDHLPQVIRLTPENSLANTLTVRVPGCRGDDFVVAADLQGMCCSTGSACSSGKQSVSHVPLAMGMSEGEAREVIRFSLDWDADERVVEQAVKIIQKVVQQMRSEALSDDRNSAVELIS